MAAKKRLTATLSVRDMPEVLWEMRQEMARLLRDEAQVERQLYTARRLVEVAEAFEAGLSKPDRKNLT